MKLIDANALFAEFENVGWYNNADRDEIAEPLILQAQTIDAVSVVHGKWIKRHGTINCSVCKRSNWSACFEDTVRSFNFCPNCGAKMKGADDEDN